MKLSIIIPVYNTAPFLAMCLESCLQQNVVLNADYEIVCVNDGSTDDSRTILQEYKLRGVKVLEQENQGVSAARNHGLRAATGDYVWFVDSDDCIAPNIVGPVLEYMYSMDVACLKINYMKVPVGFCMQAPGDDCTIEELPQGARYPSPGDFVWQFIVSRDYLLRHKIFFNEQMSFAEDSEWYFWICLHGAEITRVTNTFYYYIQRTTSVSHVRNEAKYQNSMFAMIQSYKRALKFPNLSEMGIKKADIELRLYSCVQNLLFNALNFSRQKRDELMDRLEQENLYPFPFLWRRFDFRSGPAYVMICSLCLFFPIRAYYISIWNILHLFNRK